MRSFSFSVISAAALFTGTYALNTPYRLDYGPDVLNPSTVFQGFPEGGFKCTTNKISGSSETITFTKEDIQGLISHPAELRRLVKLEGVSQNPAEGTSGIKPGHYWKSGTVNTADSALRLVKIWDKESSEVELIKIKFKYDNEADPNTVDFKGFSYSLVKCP